MTTTLKDPKDQAIIADILRLKKERRAVILAHNYQIGEIQDLADFTGDSLGLTQAAAKTDAKVIVFCGVHFMAETAAIMNPDKIVVIPDVEAGCSLAAMISGDSLRRWKAEHPGAVVVTYINCTAEVKAETDILCTSTNALKVVESIPPEQEILFAPDQFLGAWVKQKTGRANMHIWPGYCHVHNRIKTDEIKQLKADHPQAKFIMHPECGCSTSCMPLADKVASTEGILKHCHASKDPEFIVGTEVGILHRLAKENPGKTFYPATAEASCEFMKLNTLEKLLWCLEDLQPRVTVAPDVAAKARRAIERMLAISDPGGFSAPKPPVD
jgi:quinolinate synthase